MHSPLWTWLSVCISLMPTSPVSSDRSLLSRAQPAPCNTAPDELTLTTDHWPLTWLMGLPGLTGLRLVLVLHRLHRDVAAAGT